MLKTVREKLRTVDVALRFWIGPRVILFLPGRSAYRLAGWLARVQYHRRRKRLAARGVAMQRCLNSTQKQADLWLSRAHELGASEQLDVSQYGRMKPERILRLTEIRGLDRLNEALDLGRGVILYSGHVYGVMTFFAAVATRGTPVNMITLPEAREELAKQHFRRRRFEFLTQQLGIRPLRLEPSNFGVAIQALNALRRNEIVTVVIDQSNSRPLVPVDFLSGRSMFPLGPALVAKAAGAPLLPFWISRVPSWRPQVAEFGDISFVDEAPEDAIQRCATWLEQRILADPASWSLWLNHNYVLPTQNHEPTSVRTSD